MADELGKIEKPDAKSVSGKRKLLLVPLIYYGQSAPDEYLAMFNNYWDQVAEQVANLESQIGKISHIYHESITEADEDGLGIIEKLNPSCHKIVRQKTDAGARIDIVEEKGLVEEALDWERCLMMGFISQKVARTVSDSYMEVAKKRYEKIAESIDETLKSTETGILIIREGHRVQFPADIEVFSVAPPALDEIHRWQRDLMTKASEEKAEEKNPEK